MPRTRSDTNRSAGPWTPSGSPTAFSAKVDLKKLGGALDCWKPSKAVGFHGGQGTLVQEG